MNRENKPRKYIPFGYKLMLSYFIFIIIPIIFLGYAVNSILVKSIREQTQTNLQGTLMQMKENISYKIEDTSRISDMLYFDYTLGHHLSRNREDWQSYYSVTTQYLIPKFHTTIEATNRKMWLSIYIHNDLLPEIYNDYKGRDPLATQNRFFDLFHIERILEKDWYLNHPAEEYGDTMEWKQIEDDKTYGRVSLLRRIVDVNTPFELQETGFIRISVYIADLFESVDYQNLGDGTTIFVLDEHKHVLISSGATDHIINQVWNAKKADDHLVIQEYIPALGWELIALVPKDITEKDTKRVRDLAILISTVCFVVFLIVSIFLSKYFSRRVSKIIAILDAFQEGAFHKRIHFKGNDEFSRISVAFNNMAQNTGELIHKVFLTEIQKKEADLESLQAQVNPHFLYNTLSSISRLAKFGESEKIQRMVMDLAKFYRLSLNEGKKVILIEDELEQVKAYLAIQKTKYEERMSVEFDVDPHILHFETIKLILQPFVENVLKHAWRGDRIFIRITGYFDEENIVFKIIDDGIGMHPNLVSQISDPIQSMNIGYGIRNVDQRIKLHFGNEYGVAIFSKRGIGTAIRITIPVNIKRN